MKQNKGDTMEISKTVIHTISEHKPCLSLSNFSDDLCKIAEYIE